MAKYIVTREAIIYIVVNAENETDAKAIIKIAKEYKEKIPKRLYDALLLWDCF